MMLLLDKGRSVPDIADDLRLESATIYRYAAAYRKVWWPICAPKRVAIGAC